MNTKCAKTEPKGIDYKIARIREGYRQTDLAKKIGICQSRISYIERGLRPTKSERVRLREALGV